MDELFLAIYEAEANGDITVEQMNDMLDVVTEKVFSNPLKKRIKKLEEIKKAKPKEYEGNEAVKEFVDKYYDDIVEMADILEKEPEDIRKNEVKVLVSYFVSMVGGSAVMMAGIGKFNVIMAGAGIIGLIISLILSIAYCIVTVLRCNTDVKAADDLSKIRAAMKKMNAKSLPDHYKNKIEDIITAIDDAETDISAKVKVTKESVRDTVLRIYESEMAGEITAEEREALLEILNESKNSEQLKKAFKNKVKNTSTTKLSELDATGDSVDLEDDDKKKPKKPMPIYVFDESDNGEQLKKAFEESVRDAALRIYESERAGEITAEEREALLETLNESVAGKIKTAKTLRGGEMKDVIKGVCKSKSIPHLDLDTVEDSLKDEDDDAPTSRGGGAKKR